MSAYRDAVMPHWRTDELKTQVRALERELEQVRAEQSRMKQEMALLRTETRRLRGEPP